MRALMSASMLWLYPASVPITAQNVLKALRAADAAKLPVKLFSSVPYVLKTCAENSELVDRLGKMDMVGIGGAPLEKNAGDELVKKGIKLVSRYGSSECGCMESRDTK
jgi:cellobiose-specific phosphotransferase system component IIC